MGSSPISPTNEKMALQELFLLLWEYAYLIYNYRMPSRRKWTDENLIEAVKSSTSIRAVIKKLALKPAGGNYSFVNENIRRLNLDKSHFKGKAWNKGLSYRSKTREDIGVLLRKGSIVQSYKLKRRLFDEGLKIPQCELCGWQQKTPDDRIPVELDHINGDNTDNRLENLRILCPNCHSLQPTHRGRNIKKVSI